MAYAVYSYGSVEYAGWLKGTTTSSTSSSTSTISYLDTFDTMDYPGDIDEEETIGDIVYN